MAKREYGAEVIWKRSQEWSPDGVLDRQLAMNRETWAELQRHGVTEDKQLRLDFAYEAPDRHSADTLARFLQNETDYDVQADAGSVAGSTQDTTISEEIL